MDRNSVQLSRVHHHAVEVLRESGVVVYPETAVRVLLAAGFTIGEVLCRGGHNWVYGVERKTRRCRDCRRFERGQAKVVFDGE